MKKKRDQDKCPGPFPFVFLVYYLLVIYGDKYLKRIPNLGAACSSHAGGTFHSYVIFGLTFDKMLRNYKCFQLGG